MTPELNRRQFIQGLGVTAATIAVGNSVFTLAGCSPATTTPTTPTTPTKPPATTIPTYKNFLIPALAKNTSSDPTKATFELIAQKGKVEFFSGKQTDTFGYNGSYLGPTIRVKKGQEVNIKVKNQLDETITTHWHGALLPGEMDGGPHQIISAGGEWNPHFVIEQPAATLWYHTHTMGQTGQQVYKGLAGLLIIDDEVSAGLNIPKDYGMNDIPLVIQDRRFAADGSLQYMTKPEDAMGMQGDTILVNGFVNSVLEVSTVKMRFRILNASNARVYNLILSDDSNFTQIASDAGFLQSPVELNALKLSPGERAEIIIDFSKHAVGDTITLKSQTNNTINIMDFSVINKANDATTIPNTLTTITKIPESAAVKTRTFTMSGIGPLSHINNLQMNRQTGMDTIHESVKLGDTEIWEVISAAAGGMSHPFHVHGMHFQVLDINGNPPPANHQGWKDTVLVETTNKVRIIAVFKYKGLFMLHCHNLEHEDAGMMLQYECK